MSARQIFLWVTAIGLIPIADSYGVAPGWSLSALFGVEVAEREAVHLFRSFMRLYLALAAY